MSTVNMISDWELSLLSRQEPPSRHEFLYTHEPVAADWHVVMGLTQPLELPNSPQRCIFLTTEPPEIMRYDLDALARYGTVLAGGFGYLRRLRNVRVETGLLPWRVGVSIERGACTVNLTRDQLLAQSRPTDDTLSVVTSQKAFTSAQVSRLKLIDYLASRVPELRTFGRDSEAVDDKADALRNSRFHLALENCYQPRFWTEKLADPIIMENVTFYSGRNRWQEDFTGAQGIIEIDVDNPKNSYETIRRVLDSDSYEERVPALQANKRAIFERLNIHSAVERMIASSGDDPGRGPTTIPRHLNRRERLLRNPLAGFGRGASGRG